MDKKLSLSELIQHAQACGYSPTKARKWAQRELTKPKSKPKPLAEKLTPSLFGNAGGAR
jgi:hypothetical protein